MAVILAMENLKRLRIERNMSQMELALALGIPQSTYQQYESGTHEAGYDTLIFSAGSYKYPSAGQWRQPKGRHAGPAAGKSEVYRGGAHPAGTNRKNA